MLKDLQEALDSLVSSLATKPFATLSALVLAFLCFVTYKSYDALEEAILTPAEESARFRKALENNALITESLVLLKDSLGAHDITIRQFHNGKHDLTGLPFTASTVTYATEPYLAGQEEPLSSSAVTLRRVWDDIDNPKCIITYTPQDSSSMIYMRNFNISKMVTCPLTNLLNYPIGTLTVGFSESDTLNEEVILTRTQAISRRITGYLNDAA